MLTRIIMAILVAVAVALVCIFLGVVLDALKVDIAKSIGAFLTEWAGAIGVLAGLLWFFGGGSFNWPKRTE